MELLKKVYNIVYSFFVCKDMKALYWLVGTQAIAGSMDILSQQLLAWDPNNMITLVVGLIISRITKKLNTKA